MSPTVLLTHVRETPSILASILLVCGVVHHLYDGVFYGEFWLQILLIPLAINLCQPYRDFAFSWCKKLCLMIWPLQSSLVFSLPSCEMDIVKISESRKIYFAEVCSRLSLACLPHIKSRGDATPLQLSVILDCDCIDYISHCVLL